MTKYLLSLQYRGTAYCGFQVQKNGVSVQEKVQDAIEVLYGKRLPVKGCSRTDAGVHALDFRLSFEDAGDVPRFAAPALPQALNAHLPQDIAVRWCTQVAPEFHVRYDVKSKTYLYLIWNRPVPHVFLQGLCWHVRTPLDVAKMQFAAKALCGRRDFRSFAAGACDKEDTVRTVFSFAVTETDGLLRLRVTADGFLYNMVRILAGTLFEIGAGKRPADSVCEIVEQRNRAAAGMTAPPQGLYLEEVRYRSLQE